MIPLRPSSFWFHSVTLQTDSKDRCSVGAVVVPCPELKPKYTPALGENQMYLAEGSTVYFHINLANSSHLSSHYRLWVFKSYEHYSAALFSSEPFDGVACRNPWHGDWCREVESNTPPFLSYNITQRDYYYVACQPDGQICLDLRYKWSYLQGYYDIHDYTTNREYYSIQYAEPSTIQIREFFQFNLTEQCLLVSSTHANINTCRHGLSSDLVVGNIVKRSDLLLFPLLVVTLSLLLLIISLSRCFRLLWRRRRRRGVDIMVIGNLHQLLTSN